MAITATTKQYEAIPYGDPVSQVITIPAGIFGSNTTDIDNPAITIENPTTHETGINFSISLKFMQGQIQQKYLIQESFTYDEVFTVLATSDFSAYYTSGATDSVSFLGYLMTSMTEVYERLLNKVSWLDGKIQEKV